MKINPTININDKNLKFKAGMTKAIKSEILMTDCNKVQKLLQKEQGINADFAGNKVIAWSVYNVTKLLSELKGLCKPKTFLPLNIMTRNVDEFYEDDDNFICGFTNYLPYKNEENPKESLPAMSIVFNKDFDWEKQFELALDKSKPRKYRDKCELDDDEMCAMCGEYCAVKIAKGDF